MLIAASFRGCLRPYPTQSSEEASEVDLSQVVTTGRRLKPKVDLSGTTAGPPVLESFRSMHAVRRLVQESRISHTNHAPPRAGF